MSNDADAMFEQQHGRVLDRQRAQVETAKLVTTFATAIAATVLASALQVLRGTPETKWSSGFLAACFLVTILVMVADRISEPDLDPSVIKLFATHDAFREYVEAKALKAEYFNASVLDQIRMLVGLQLALAGISGAIAACSLLAGNGTL